MAWLAFVNPLELELREGSVWIHVLAKRAGIDIYDARQVAFVNMNHGPLDPILKTWVSTLLPGLPGHMITRIFVLLCPLFLLAAAYVVSRRNLTCALFAAGSLYLISTHVSPLIFVGRSDATAVCGTAVCGMLAHQLLVRRSPGFPRSYTLLQVSFGAASAAVFLISWRYLPALGALYCPVIAQQAAEAFYAKPTSLRSTTGFVARSLAVVGHLLRSLSLYLVGFAMLWVPVFLFELHGDFQEYYRRFFGFFTPAGWGYYPGGPFRLFPIELVIGREALLWLFVGCIVVGLYRPRLQRLQMLAWLCMLPALWLTIAYGYFKNQVGGGLHYFFEFFVVAWVFVLHALCTRRRSGASFQVALVLVVAWLLPWDGLVVQHERAHAMRERAETFRDTVPLRTQGQPVFGEGTHLLKTHYSGELVDTGDVAQAIATSGYFGLEFTKTYQRYLIQLSLDPPQFVVAGLLNGSLLSGALTPSLQSLLQLHYKRVLTASKVSMTEMESQVLFERKAQ